MSLCVIRVPKQHKEVGRGFISIKSWLLENMNQWSITVMGDRRSRAIVNMQMKFDLLWNGRRRTSASSRPLKRSALPQKTNKRKNIDKFREWLFGCIGHCACTPDQTFMEAAHMSRTEEQGQTRLKPDTCQRSWSRSVLSTQSIHRYSFSLSVIPPPTFRSIVPFKIRCSSQSICQIIRVPEGYESWMGRGDCLDIGPGSSTVRSPVRTALRLIPSHLSWDSAPYASQSRWCSR
jgi:hypothetical protein